MNIIPIERVISSVKGNLGIEHTSTYDPSIERWINEAVYHLDTKSQFIKMPYLLKIENNCAYLPNGCDSVIGMRFVNSVEDPTAASPIIYVDKNFLNDINGWQYQTVSNLYGIAQIEQNKILFTGTIPDQSKGVEITCLGRAVDRDCLYLIYEMYERACNAYARWRFYEAFPEMKGIQYSIGLMDRAQREWIRQKAWIKGRDVTDDFKKNKYTMGMIFKAWLVRRNNFND